MVLPPVRVLLMVALSGMVVCTLNYSKLVEEYIEMSAYKTIVAGSNQSQNDDYSLPLPPLQLQQMLVGGEQQYQQRDVQFQVPTEFLINQAQERSASIAKFRPTPKDVRLAKAYPAFAGVPIQKEWQQTHFPDINIVGLPKAGTSHLYHLLTTHKDLRQFMSTKEACFEKLHVKLRDMNKSTGGGLAYNVTKWANMTYDERLRDTLKRANSPKLGWPPQEPGRQTVNGCLHPESVLKQRDYVKRADAKYILLLRDPADWLWSAYNFWRRPAHEDVNRKGWADWASAPKQYRSPELFHEYMLSGGRTWAARDLLTLYRDNTAAWTPQLMWDVIGPQNLLVLKSEDFAPDVVLEKGVLDRLATFLHISPTGFDPNITHSIGNCNNVKGTDTVCEKASNAYKITGGRGMLEETRDLVYLQFAEECKYWAETFNIVYEGCINVGKKYLKPVSNR